MALGLSEAILKHGRRWVAGKLVDQRIQRICGMSKDDLPDSSAVCNLVDNIEEMLEQPMDNEGIKNALAEINEEFIQELVFS